MLPISAVKMTKECDYWTNNNGGIIYLKIITHRLNIISNFIMEKTSWNQTQGPQRKYEIKHAICLQDWPPHPCLCCWDGAELQLRSSKPVNVNWFSG